MSRKDADHQLQLHGIRVQPQSGSGDDAAVLFAAAHRQLTSLVADSDFATDLIGRLARLPGAWKSREGKPRSKVRFAGASLRYVSVPLELCVSAEEDAGSVVGSSMPAGLRCAGAVLNQALRPAPTQPAVCRLFHSGGWCPRAGDGVRRADVANGQILFPRSTSFQAWERTWEHLKPLQCCLC